MFLLLCDCNGKINMEVLIVKFAQDFFLGEKIVNFRRNVVTSKV
jgi:hypothetical protein